MNPTPNLWNAKWKFNDELQRNNDGTYPTVRHNKCHNSSKPSHSTISTPTGFTLTLIHP